MELNQSRLSDLGNPSDVRVARLICDRCSNGRDALVKHSIRARYVRLSSRKQLKADDTNYVIYFLYRMITPCFSTP